jgi:hypothetical protein
MSRSVPDVRRLTAGGAAGTASSTAAAGADQDAPRADVTARRPGNFGAGQRESLAAARTRRTRRGDLKAAGRWPLALGLRLARSTGRGAGRVSADECWSAAARLAIKRGPPSAFGAPTGAWEQCEATLPRCPTHAASRSLLAAGCCAAAPQPRRHRRAERGAAAPLQLPAQERSRRCGEGSGRALPPAAASRRLLAPLWRTPLPLAAPPTGSGDEAPRSSRRRSRAFILGRRAVLLLEGCWLRLGVQSM